MEPFQKCNHGSPGAGSGYLGVRAALWDPLIHTMNLFFVTGT
jgi:hypothetical protein